MKSKDNLFNEKMPSSLRSKILSEADQHLKNNTNLYRRSILSWVFGIGISVAVASFSFIIIRKNEADQKLEMAQSIELFEDFQNEEDFEMLADFELIENFEIIDET